MYLKRTHEHAGEERSGNFGQGLVAGGGVDGLT